MHPSKLSIRQSRRSLRAATHDRHCARARRKGSQEQRPDIDRLCRLVANDLVEQVSTQRWLDLQQIDDEHGWGFIASDDIDEDQTLVSVPLSQTIIGIDDCSKEVPWNVQMAEQLLQRLYSGAADPWIDALPGHVDLPFLYWDEEEIARLGDPALEAEIFALRDFIFSTDVREYLSDYDWEDILWAFSIIHSRSFVFGEGKHLFCPLIDMANHSAAANATVNLHFNTNRCQGQEAVDEIAPPTTASSSDVDDDSVFDMVATREIKTGEQVLISYGAQPNDVLLLYFGFALASNDHDVVSFTSQDLRAVMGPEEKRGEHASVDDAPSGDRFFVTSQGMDARLSERLSSSADLVELCRRKLNHLLETDTKYETAVQSEEEPRDALASSRVRTAAAYRRNKISLLSTVISLST